MQLACSLIRYSTKPNKVISDLCGAPLIERILQRVKKVKKIKTIILATTKGRDDDILVDIAKSNTVKVFRGSENDLVDRYYQAVKGKKLVIFLDYQLTIQFLIHQNTID